MEKRLLSPARLLEFARKLQEDERSSATIENYLRHIRAFAVWAGGRPVTKELTAAWKEHLTGEAYCSGSVNTMLVSLNRFLGFLGWGDCAVKTLRVQRRLFREDSKELTRAEYERLVAAAQASGRERLVLLLETICSTGIRVSEVKYITVEALRQGKAEISLKGKIRTILLPGKLSRILLPNIVLVNAGFTVATLLILMNVQFEHEVMLKEQEKQLAEGRIDIMLSQIQPHFLYNSLGVIYSLCATDPEAARKAIKRFSDFLRGNMDSLKNREPIPFDAELNHVMNYLYLEQQRFGDKLQVIYQIKTEDFLIPPLTVQPLVENAVQHGVLHRKNGGTVVIRTEETDAGALVTIEDNGVGMEKAKEHATLGEHSHIGISNVRARLEEMVGGRLTLESNSLGTTATILIPWKEERSL